MNSGDLDSIISSGDIALISNRELRQRVGRWPATLSKVRDLIRRDRDFFSNRFMPYLSANMHLPPISTLPFSVPGHREVAYAYGLDINVAKTTEHRELLSRPEFQNLLWERAGSINDILYSALGFEDESREPRADILEDLKSAIELEKSAPTRFVSLSTPSSLDEIKAPTASLTSSFKRLSK